MNHKIDFFQWIADLVYKNTRDKSKWSRAQL